MPALGGGVPFSRGGDDYRAAAVWDAIGAVVSSRGRGDPQYFALLGPLDSVLRAQVSPEQQLLSKDLFDLSHGKSPCRHRTSSGGRRGVRICEDS
jgi:hypothetical protein